MVNTNRIPSLINYSHWKRPKVTKYYNWGKRHKREPQGEYGECDGGLTEKGRRKLSRRGGGAGGLLSEDTRVHYHGRQLWQEQRPAGSPHRWTVKSKQGTQKMSEKS